MPPLRPLPDLVLITTFKMLTPNDQLAASLTSPRCAVLVRAANRTVKTLAITDQNVEDPGVLDEITYSINDFSLASYPAMQPLMDSCADGEPSFTHYPLATTPFNYWNVLQLDPLGLQLNSPTVIRQITTIFSAVTDLNFTTYSYSGCKLLAALLQLPNWQCRLTNLTVNGDSGKSNQLGRELITAINGLPALQQLALDWPYTYKILPDLTILAQLKVVALGSFRLQTLVRSLKQYATDNAHLQVYLLCANTNGLLSLSQPLSSRIVYLGHEKNYFDLPSTLRLCGQFRFLTSLYITKIPFTQVGQLFTALSQLHQLVHLGLWVDCHRDEDELPAAPRPLAQMNSLRALELRLNIASHSDIKWFNLPWTMPNLQTIYIDEFGCDSCEFDFLSEYSENWSLINSPEALPCLKSSLFTLHSGVPLNRFILPLIEEQGSTSAEKLLLQTVSQ